MYVQYLFIKEIGSGSANIMAIFQRKEEVQRPPTAYQNTM